MSPGSSHEVPPDSAAIGGMQRSARRLRLLAAEALRGGTVGVEDGVAARARGWTPQRKGHCWLPRLVPVRAWSSCLLVIATNGRDLGGARGAYDVRRLRR